MTKASDSDALATGLAALVERGWYANNGPLLVELEQRLARAVAGGIAGVDAVALATAEAAAYLLAYDTRARGGALEVGPRVHSSLVSALDWAAAAALPPGAPRSGGGSLRLIAADDLAATTPTTAAPGRRAPRAAAADPGACVVVDCTGLVPRDVVVCRELLAGGASVLLSMRQGTAWTCGEGGALLTRDAALRDFLRTARNHHAGQTLASTPMRFNFKASEAQALVALQDLARLLPHAERG